MKVRRLVALCTAMFLSLQMAGLPASAAGRFSNVPAGSPFYESVTYLAECGITAGKGGHSFSPERPITVREWAALLFRAFDGSTLSCDSPKERSELGIQRCYQNGWLGVSAAISLMGLSAAENCCSVPSIRPDCRYTTPLSMAMRRQDASAGKRGTHWKGTWTVPRSGRTIWSAVASVSQ